MALLDSNDYDSIRDRIGPGQTRTQLPDPKIERYLPEAERYVSSRADVGGLDEAGLEHARLAAIYYCASLIAPTADIPTSDAVSGAGMSFSRKVMEPGANARRLLSLAEGELAYLTTDVVATDEAPTSFAVRVETW